MTFLGEKSCTGVFGQKVTWSCFGFLAQPLFKIHLGNWQLPKLLLWQNIYCWGECFISVTKFACSGGNQGIYFGRWLMLVCQKVMWSLHLVGAGCMIWEYTYLVQGSNQTASNQSRILYFTSRIPVLWSLLCDFLKEKSHCKIFSYCYFSHLFLFFFLFEFWYTNSECLKSIYQRPL